MSVEQDPYRNKRLALGGEGILTDKDLEELSKGSKRVYELMSDGLWHSADEVRMAAGNGNPASEGLRRLRELRELATITKKRGEGRNFSYRMEAKEIPESVQSELFDE